MIMILINTADSDSGRFTQWIFLSELTVHGIAEGTVSWHMLVVKLVHCPLIVMIATAASATSTATQVSEISFGVRFGGRFPVIATAASSSASATNHITRTGARCDVDHVLVVGARRRQRGGQFGVLGQRVISKRSV